MVVSMGVRARRAAPWLSACAAAALALLGAGPGPASAATSVARGSALAGACTGPITLSPQASSFASQGDTSQSTGVRLPQDEAPHQQPQEWWYFSGHLWGVDPSGHLHCCGFEYVTFQFVDLAPVPVYFGNFAVTDLTRGTFQYGAQQDSCPVPDTPRSFSLHTAGWTMSGGSGTDTLHADLPDYTLDLQLRTTEPAALHGDNGVIPFGPLGTSDYYSWTSLLASGTILDHGVPVKVTGLSWVDHQWGAFNFASGAGWDWFSVQLAGGRQYMLYFIRNSSATIVHTLGIQVTLGQTTHLDPSAVSETTTGSWTSPPPRIPYAPRRRLTPPAGYL